MFYSPIVEIIEKLIKKANNYGSRVYWGWTLVVGLFGALFIYILDEYGFSEAKPFLAIWLFLYFGCIYPVSRYEKLWKSKKDKR